MLEVVGAKISPPQKCSGASHIAGLRMDKLAVFEAENQLSSIDSLRIAAQLAAHGIDCLILPPGVSLAVMTGSECDPLDDDEE